MALVQCCCWGDIIAYDAADSHDGHKRRFVPLREQASSSEKYPERTLLMCWPSNVSNITFGVVDLGTFRVDKIFMGIPYLLVLYVAELGHAGIIRAAKGWGDPF